MEAVEGARLEQVDGVGLQEQLLQAPQPPKLVLPHLRQIAAQRSQQKNGLSRGLEQLKSRGMEKFQFNLLQSSTKIAREQNWFKAKFLGKTDPPT